MKEAEEIQRINRSLKKGAINWFIYWFVVELFILGLYMVLPTYKPLTRTEMFGCFFFWLSWVLLYQCINLIIHIRKLNKLSK